MIGEAEDAKSIDHLITSAAVTERPTLGFEDLDSKIASGLRKILTENLKDQVAIATGTAQSEKRSLPDRLLG